MLCGFCNELTLTWNSSNTFPFFHYSQSTHFTHYSYSQRIHSTHYRLIIPHETSCEKYMDSTWQNAGGAFLSHPWLIIVIKDSSVQKCLHFGIKNPFMVKIFKIIQKIKASCVKVIYLTCMIFGGKLFFNRLEWFWFSAFHNVCVCFTNTHTYILTGFDI